MNWAWSDRMHLRAISSDSDAEDWLFCTVYLTLCPRMPPVALTWSKYASAPQLSVSPICAYGPDRARSPQATIGDFAPAALAPEAPEAPVDEDELQPASAPATINARVRGMRVCLRI